MDEYIKLAEVIMGIDGLINEAATGTQARALFIAKDMIYDQQRYFLRMNPVKRGHWEEISEYGGWGETFYKCSVCGETEYINTKYCPNCGADLRGDPE